MNIFAPNEFPIWLFVTFVAVSCLILSMYLTYHRKKAGGQGIVGQCSRLARPEALILGTARQSHLALLTFCPMCGKQAETPANADTCEFCGQNMAPISRSQIRRFSARFLDSI